LAATNSCGSCWPGAPTPPSAKAAA
jgi:hypothetical protein